MFQTEERTRNLLLIKFEKEKEFSCGSKHQISNLWRDVADKIGFRVTGNQCNQKYRNLLWTYRTNKQRASTTGTGSQAVKWPYFEIMDSVLGTKASSNPPLNSLVCSIRGVRGHQAQPEDEHYEEDVDDPQTSQQGHHQIRRRRME